MKLSNETKSDKTNESDKNYEAFLAAKKEARGLYKVSAVHFQSAAHFNGGDILSTFLAGTHHYDAWYDLPAGVVLFISKKTGGRTLVAKENTKDIWIA